MLKVVANFFKILDLIIFCQKYWRKCMRFVHVNCILGQKKSTDCISLVLLYRQIEVKSYLANPDYNWMASPLETHESRGVARLFKMRGR